MTKTIRCKITGHSDGPKCSTCSKKMDSILVEEQDHELSNAKGHYCYTCTFERKT